MSHRELYIFLQGYSSSNAASNRTHAMVKAFVDNNISVKIISVGIAETEFPCCQGVDFTELRTWKKHIKRADYYFQYYLSCHKLKQYVKTIPQGAVVLLLGCRDYLHLFTHRKDLRLYQEVTEHHTVVRTFRAERYLRDCKYLQGIFVISSSLRHFYQGIGIPDNRVHIINMFADESRFSGLKKEPISKPYIAYCGNMSNTKDGVDILLKAYSKIANKTDLNLWLIGHYNGFMDDFIKKNQLEGRVFFTGLIDYRRVPQLLVNATVLALARPESVQAANGFPTKLGEYLLTGNPVVITRVGDIPLFLEHKKTALLSESRDLESFAENLLWVANHPLESQTIGGKGKGVARKSFNYRTETKKMVDVMFNTMKRKSNEDFDCRRLLPQG